MDIRLVVEKDEWMAVMTVAHLVDQKDLLMAEQKVDLSAVSSAYDLAR